MIATLVSNFCLRSRSLPSVLLKDIKYIILIIMQSFKILKNDSRMTKLLKKI